MAGLRQLLQSSLYSISAPISTANMAPMPEVSGRRPITIAAPAEKIKIEMYSPAYYRACVIGGIMSCGLTHTMVSTYRVLQLDLEGMICSACTMQFFSPVVPCAQVTPLDVVKCNMQTDPTRYSSIPKGFSLTVAEQGLAGLVRGWGPTLVGYSIQGAGKFGLYEYFKKYVFFFPPCRYCRRLRRCSLHACNGLRGEALVAPSNFECTSTSPHS